MCAVVAIDHQQRKASKGEMKQKKSFPIRPHKKWYNNNRIYNPPPTHTHGKDPDGK